MARQDRPRHQRQEPNAFDAAEHNHKNASGIQRTTNTNTNIISSHRNHPDNNTTTANAHAYMENIIVHYRPEPASSISSVSSLSSSSSLPPLHLQRFHPVYAPDSQSITSVYSQEDQEFGQPRQHHHPRSIHDTSLSGDGHQSEQSYNRQYQTGSLSSNTSLSSTSTSVLQTAAAAMIAQAQHGYLFEPSASSSSSRSGVVHHNKETLPRGRDTDDVASYCSSDINDADYIKGDDARHQPDAQFATARALKDKRHIRAPLYGSEDDEDSCFHSSNMSNRSSRQHLERQHSDLLERFKRQQLTLIRIQGEQKTQELHFRQEAKFQQSQHDLKVKELKTVNQMFQVQIEQGDRKVDRLEKTVRDLDAKLREQVRQHQKDLSCLAEKARPLGQQVSLLANLLRRDDPHAFISNHGGSEQSSLSDKDQTPKAILTPNSIHDTLSTPSAQSDISDFAQPCWNLLKELEGGLATCMDMSLSSAAIQGLLLAKSKSRRKRQSDSSGGSSNRTVVGNGGNHAVKQSQHQNNIYPSPSSKQQSSSSSATGAGCLAESPTDVKDLDLSVSTPIQHERQKQGKDSSRSTRDNKVLPSLQKSEIALRQNEIVRQKPRARIESARCKELQDQFEAEKLEYRQHYERQLALTVESIKTRCLQLYREALGEIQNDMSKKMLTRLTELQQLSRMQLQEKLAEQYRQFFKTEQAPKGVAGGGSYPSPMEHVPSEYL